MSWEKCHRLPNTPEKDEKREGRKASETFKKGSGALELSGEGKTWRRTKESRATGRDKEEDA